MGDQTSGNAAGERRYVAPRLEQVCQAFAIAPVTAAIPAALGAAGFLASHGVAAGLLAKGAMGVGVLAGAFGYPVALLFGAPFYLLFRERRILSAVMSPVVGAAIGGFATLGLLALAAPQLRNTLYLRGLIGWPQLLVMGLASGAAPGFVFYVVATQAWKRPVASAR